MAGEDEEFFVNAGNEETCDAISGRRSFALHMLVHGPVIFVASMRIAQDSDFFSQIGQKKHAQVSLLCQRQTGISECLLWYRYLAREPRRKKFFMGYA